jgi:FdhD protein
MTGDSAMLDEFIVTPNPLDARLSTHVTGIDHLGNDISTDVVIERPLTLYLNSREVVTLMTVGDHPKYLALGFLLNQNMLKTDDEITGIDFDDDLDVIVVRTKKESDYEQKLKKKIRTSGCAQGTVFGDIMESFDSIKLPSDATLHTSWLYSLFKKINRQPSLYLKTGAIHGCVLCEEDRPLVYMEDVGRHNAVDKIAGYMYLHDINPDNKIFFTTGRLTSEMVIKTVQMGLPILMSRSGFTAWGVELARKANLTLLGRAKGKRFIALSGAERIIFDADPEKVAAEPTEMRRKGAEEKHHEVA